MNEEVYYQLGQTLKIIRQNKGYTQKEVSDSTMSRSNYTKLENDEINPSIVKFHAILDYMDMTQEEFSFILNGYKLNKKDQLMHLFKEMNHSPSLSYLKHVIESASDLLKEREDHITRDILNLSLGYWELLHHHDLDKAKSYAELVWDRLKELDKLYLSEYHLLSKILYFFEVETVTFLTDKALSDLDVYHPFREAKELKLSYLSHIACILIESKDYEKAMVYIDQLIEYSKRDYNVIVLASALVRRGLISSDTEGMKKASRSDYHSATQMFSMLERDDLVKQTKENPKAVYNPYGYVTLFDH